MQANKLSPFVFFLILFPAFIMAQNWNLKLKSKVELRSWKLTSKAVKNEQFLNGATIKLCKASAVISQTTSDPEGNFEMNIPANGDYTLVITYPGCNPKKFSVNTKGVPSNVADANFKPSVQITGFIMSKPIKGINYLGLNQPLVNVEYKTDNGGFDKSVEATNKGVELVSKIYDAEYKVIQKFCTANKLGDIALDKKDYLLAKTYYLMAMDMMDGEPYPKTQLKKALEGLKEEKAANKSKSLGKTKNKGKTKSKTNSSKQNIIAKPTKSADFKNSRETGKSTRKIAKPL